MKCIYCDEPVVKIDNEYEEGYCEFHFTEQQRSNEPVTDHRDA